MVVVARSKSGGYMTETVTILFPIAHCLDYAYFEKNVR